MRLLGDLLDYVHSYSKHLYLFDLNKQKWIKIDNENINTKFDYRERCTYCVHDVKERNGREKIIPRCDVNVSTRSRFFKHLQELETDLNRRLVCFENELSSFQFNDDLLGDRIPFFTDNMLQESRVSVQTESVDNSEAIDRFLKSICRERNLEHAEKSSNESDQSFSPSHSSHGKKPDNEFDDNSNSPSTHQNNDYKQDLNNRDLKNNLDSELDNDLFSDLNNNSSCESNNNSQNSSFDSDDTCHSIGSLPFRPPSRSHKRKIKSIYAYEQESKNESPNKRTRHDSSILNHSVVVNQIVGDQIKFLCFLDEV